MIHICRHPLIQDKLLRLRDKKTPPLEFRNLMAEAGALIGYEALADLRAEKKTVDTFLGRAHGAALGEKVVLVAILRAGLGLLSGISQIAPQAAIGHIGLYRDEETLNP